MKNNNHLHLPALAAALLLLPLAAGLALPAAAQPHGGPVPMQRPAGLEIDRFVIQPQGRIEAGRKVQFRVTGTPGARVTVEVPGVRTVTLRETRPGVYEADYTVGRRDDIRAFDRAVATLQRGNARVSERVGRDGRDRRDPQVTDLAPADGARVSERGQVTIAARLRDDDSGVDRGSVQLRLNGRDVTRSARVTDDQVQYRADLQPGRYRVELALRDRAGNATTRSWQFEVVDERPLRPGPQGRPPVSSVPPQLVPPQLTSHRNNALIDAAQDVWLQGRAFPDAVVQVQVVAHAGGRSETIADYVVHTDGNGFFNARVRSPHPPRSGMRYDVQLTATGNDGRRATERYTLVQR